MNALRKYLLPALACAMTCGSARADVILSAPQFSDADSFHVFLELTQPLGFEILALQLNISFDPPLTQAAVNPVEKMPGVPGTYETFAPTFGTISYLDPISLPVGQLFKFNFDGAIATPSSVNVSFLVFTADEVEVPFQLAAEVSAVPEPGTLLFLATGVGLVILVHRMRGTPLQLVRT